MMNSSKSTRNIHINEIKKKVDKKVIAYLFLPIKKEYIQLRTTFYLSTFI